MGSQVARLRRLVLLPAIALCLIAPAAASAGSPGGGAFGGSSAPAVVDQYTESFPGSAGPSEGSQLPIAVRRAVQKQGGGDAALLEKLAGTTGSPLAPPAAVRQPSAVSAVFQAAAVPLLVAAVLAAAIAFAACLRRPVPVSPRRIASR